MKILYFSALNTQINKAWPFIRAVIIKTDGNTKGGVLDHCSPGGAHGGSLSAEEVAACGGEAVRQLHRPQLRLLQIHRHLHQARRPPPLRNDLPRQKDLSAVTSLEAGAQVHPQAGQGRPQGQKIIDFSPICQSNRVQPPQRRFFQLTAGSHSANTSLKRGKRKCPYIRHHEESSNPFKPKIRQKEISKIL